MTELTIRPEEIRTALDAFVRSYEPTAATAEEVRETAISNRGATPTLRLRRALPPRCWPRPPRARALWPAGPPVPRMDRIRISFRRPAFARPQLSRARTGDRPPPARPF